VLSVSTQGEKLFMESQTSVSDLQEDPRGIKAKFVDRPKKGSISGNSLRPQAFLSELTKPDCANL